MNLHIQIYDGVVWRQPSSSEPEGKKTFTGWAPSATFGSNLDGALRAVQEVEDRGSRYPVRVMDVDAYQVVYGDEHVEPRIVLDMGPEEGPPEGMENPRRNSIGWYSV